MDYRWAGGRQRGLKRDRVDYLPVSSCISPGIIGTISHFSWKRGKISSRFSMTRERVTAK
jgi:hypothetical protein